MKLADVPARCFHGVIPSVIATTAADGTPNVAYLSAIERLDDERIALSCQFFNKTKQNTGAVPRACLEVYDPLTFEAYRMEVEHEGEEREGPLFERMAMRIDAIASQMGMRGIFRLRSAEIFRVRSLELREGFLDGTELRAMPARDPRPRSELRGLQLVSDRIRNAPDLEGLLRALFAALDEALGFSHVMMFVPDESRCRLFVLGSAGYPEDGAGAEVAMGEGLVGIVAQERRVLRVSGIEAELRYGRAIRAGVRQTSARRSLGPEIPLPGLHDAASHIVIPLVVEDRLLGVLAVESRDPHAFEEWHEAFLDIVAHQVAATMDRVLRRDEPEDEGPITPSLPPADVPTGPVFRYFAKEECVFAGDEYLIRAVPARIFWHLLQVFRTSGRVDFTNRELRMQSHLGLPDYRDNLESRLVLLRRRLEQKCPHVRITPTGRGRFRLDVPCNVVLEERP